MIPDHLTLENNSVSSPRGLMLFPQMVCWRLLVFATLSLFYAPLLSIYENVPLHPYILTVDHR